MIILKTKFKKRVRPTLMSPVWKVGSVILGAVTTRLGQIMYTLVLKLLRK